MAAVLLPLFLLTIAALAAAYLLRRRFTETLPLTALSAMLILYAFYAFGFLRAGRIFVIVLCAALTGLALLRLLRRRDGGRFLRAEALSPQMAAYLLLTASFYVLSQNKLVGLWDELRLWGSLPKALFAFGTPQFGENASLFAFSQSYPPALPLLQYFFASFSPVFSEGSLFFTRAWLGLTLLLPVTRNLTWSRWHGLTACAFLIFFVPYVLTTNDPDFAFYYESLYVDAPAGILCGFLCWQAMDDCTKDRFSAIAFALSLMALTLMKDFGVLFGGLCVAGSLAWVIRAQKGNGRRQALVRTAAATGALAIAYLSWQVLMRVYGVINYNTVDATLPAPDALFRSLSFFLSSVVTVNLSAATLSVTFGAVLLLILLCYVFFVVRDKAEFRRDLPFIILRIIGYGGYFFAYVMMFRDDIAGSVYPSIARYMVAMALCETLVLLMALTRVRPGREPFLWKPFPALGGRGKAGAVLLAAGLVLLSAFTVGTFWKYDGGVYEDAATAAALVEENADAPEGETADVWLLIGGDAWENSLLHHRIYFDLVGTKARVKTYILEANITQSGRAYTEDTFLAALAKASIEYVLVVYGDDELQSEFGNLFPELIPYETDDLLYKVEYAQNGVPALTFVAAP